MSYGICKKVRGCSIIILVSLAEQSNGSGWINWPNLRADTLLRATLESRNFLMFPAQSRGMA
jgi:hypothetical protein